MLGSLAICFLVVSHNLKNSKSIVLCDWRQSSSKAYWCINEKKKTLCFCFPSFIHESILGDLQAVWCWCLAECFPGLWLWHDGSVQFLATAKATQKCQRTKAQTWLKCLITKRKQKTNHDPSAAERMKQKKDELTCKLQKTEEKLTQANLPGVEGRGQEIKNVRQIPAVKELNVASAQAFSRNGLNTFTTQSKWERLGWSNAIETKLWKPFNALSINWMWSVFTVILQFWVT